MKNKKLLELSCQISNSFISTLEGESYQPRGIFNSEALLLVSLVEYFQVRHIIESGRARGHSTNLLAKYFRNTPVKITSIDFDKNSDDAEYSENYLKKHKNLELIYGDAHEILTQEMREDCIVFIDGPKGDEAIQLAIELLEDRRVKAVAIHDLHKNTWHRNICESIFSETFFSDDEDFVKNFKHLDEDCWKTLEGTGEAPYQRYGKPIASYASTLGVIFNSDKPFIQPALDNYLKYFKQHQPTFAKAFVARVPHNSILYKTVTRVYRLFKK